jgi:DNA-binding Lrp family transcriptional regulator
MFQGGTTGFGMFEVLDDEQVARLTPHFEGHGAPVEERDQPLLDALAKDGRAGYADLAAATGWSESTVRRRLEHLRQTGGLYFDLELDAPAFGFHTHAWLWMSVAPAELVTVGEALARLPEVTFAAATTGPTNLAASVVCRDAVALYELITQRISTFPGIHQLEAATTIRTLKQSGPFLPGTV